MINGRKICRINYCDGNKNSKKLQMKQLKFFEEITPINTAVFSFAESSPAFLSSYNVMYVAIFGAAIYVAFVITPSIYYKSSRKE